MEASYNYPIGIHLLRKCCTCIKLSPSTREFSLRMFILIATFFSYISYHMSRRPLSVVKNMLNRDCTKLIPPLNINITSANNESWCDWEPFSGNDANELLGYLDSSYLFSYAAFMFISGILAERLNLRYYLSFGMILSGLFTYLFGLAYNLQIHSFAYFIVIQVLAGGFQSTGWPSVVSCVGNWFGKSKRGLIFGIWNSHLYLGNILGAYVAGVFVEKNWGFSFMVPGIIIAALGILVFLFLMPYPEEVGCSTPHLPSTIQGKDAPSNTQSYASEQASTSCETPGIIQRESLHTMITENNANKGRSMPPISQSNDCVPGVNELQIPMRPVARNESMPLMKDCSSSSSLQDLGAISFYKAVKIPGVIEFSLCLFFSKLVSYTFLFWLPKYIETKTEIGSQDSAYLSVPFDVGGIIGGVMAGIISDQTGASASTCIVFLGLAIPSMFIYDIFGSANTYINIALQVVTGSLVNGPYALITTAVSAELGTHSSLMGNTRALATVTAIIDGCGSIGAAVGPLLAGVVSGINWKYVFYMMMVSDFLALLTLLRAGWKEMHHIGRTRGWCSSWKI